MPNHLSVLFATYRYDPKNLDGGSGFDHDYYHMFTQNQIQTQVVGPFQNPDARIENIFSKLYKKLSGRSYAKFRLSGCRTLSSELTQAAYSFHPDIIFTIWPNFLVYYKGHKPVVYAVDTCLYGQQLQMPTYGSLAMKITEWEEQRAFDKAAFVITHSDWSKHVIMTRYGVSDQRIEVIPVPSSLPENVIPSRINVRDIKELQLPLRLLLVGRVYYRKGIDIAIEVTKILNQRGLPTELTICGLQMASDSPNVRFVGSFKKSDPFELQNYVDLYKKAHLLIHPARFEAAGIAPSEAAAFGTPTITNASGGLATTVADGVSGIVLPKSSSAELYAEEIINLVHDPKRYYRLCATTRERYDRELNWTMAGKRIMAILGALVKE